MGCAVPARLHLRFRHHPARRGATKDEKWMRGGWRQASWTAAVLCRFCDQYAGESARGLAHSKTLRAHVPDRYFLVGLHAAPRRHKR